MGDESNEFHREADKTVAAAHTQADQMVASAQQTAKELTERGQAAVQVFCFNVFSAGSSVFFRSVGGWFSPVSSSCSQ